MRVILVREPGELQTVYVRCHDCTELVARYRLTDYYHHGKGIDSFLRSQGETDIESGRRVLREFEQAREEAVTGYEAVLRQLEEEGKTS
jgi:hypothetical protein